MSRARDEAMMRLALEAARRGVGRTSPNPAVGAVIAKGDTILSVGHHARAGADHAEVAALRPLGFRAPGATLYCTLEPCHHVGRTGPCTEAILAAGVRRVVIGAIDPNPRVNRRGVRALERGGVAVTVGVLEPECRAINEAFEHAIVHESPFVVLKVASSLDGRVATRTGESQWITSAAARRKARELRAESDAVIVGVGTALADDPRLTARIRGRPDPVRVVVDSRLRCSPELAVVKSARETPTWIVTTEAAPARRRRALERAGVEVMSARARRDGRVDVGALLELLHARERSGVFVEGGPRLQASFVEAGAVHKVVWFLAPMLIGGPRAALEGPGVAALSAALRLREVSIEKVGPDFMFVAKRA